MPTVPPTVPESEPVKSARERLYDVSKASIGREMSPEDRADDEVGCVESLEGVYKAFCGRYISGHLTPFLSTYALYKALQEHPDFMEVDEPLPGDIVVSPTGLGNGRIKNGHTGIVGFKDWMSNDSRTGKWEANYSHESWLSYYGVRGGFPIAYFRPR
jgi:hypothetical protein